MHVQLVRFRPLFGIEIETDRNLCGRCYSGVTDVKGFVDLSDMLEAIGASAYSGATKYLHNAVRTIATSYIYFT